MVFVEFYKWSRAADIFDSLFRKGNYLRKERSKSNSGLEQVRGGSDGNCQEPYLAVATT